MRDNKVTLLRFILLIPLFCVFLLPGTAVPKTNIQEKLSDNSLHSLYHDFKEACQSGQLVKAQDALKKMENWKLDRGYRNVPFLSDVVIKAFDRSQLRHENTWEQRLSIYRDIAKLSPDEPHFRWQSFKSYFYAHPLDIYHHFINFRSVFTPVKTNIVWTIDLGGELILAFLATLFLTTFGMAVNFIIKYAYHLVFYLKQFVRVPISNLLANLLLFVIFFLPIFFNIGFAWLPLFWMVLLWMILTKREKGVVLFLVIIFALASFGAKHIGRFYMAGANNGTFLLYQANYNQLEPTGYESLKKQEITSEGDADILFTLGLLAKRRGDYREALTYYQRALNIDPNFHECMNNLGNVYLLMKQSGKDAVAKARLWYNKAIKIDPTRAEYFYNLSKSYPLLDVEGMEYVVRARDLDPEQIDQLTRRNSHEPNQMLVDSLLPGERLWHRAFLPGKLSNTLSTLFWRFFLNTPMENVYVMPVVLFLIIILFSLMQKRVGTAASCAKCGQLFFRRIPVHFRQRLCHQCAMIQSRSSKADPDIVKQKEVEAVRYRKRRKVLGFLMGILPFGGGFVLKNRPFIGLLISFLFFSFLSYFLVCRQVFPGLATLFFGYAGCSYFSLVIAILIYLSGLTQMIVTYVREGF